MKSLLKKCFFVMMFFQLSDVLHARMLQSEKLVTVRGKAVDGQTQRPLYGVNVVIVGTLRGASTDEAGIFILALPPGKYRLEARCVGYVARQIELEVPARELDALVVELEPTTLELPAFVVTGTRSEKLLEEAPIPTTVVSASDIRLQGATDLREVLAEQPGLNIVQDHGSGVQVQGFDPDYTLILIDGSPVIGRVAGTLDLTRFAVGNLERVEIVKGPTSSLYGSEALAGVINLITREPRLPLAFNVSGKFGQFNSKDMTASFEMRRGKLGGHFFYNRKSRGHYDFNPATISWTAPEFADHTLSGKLLWAPSARAKLTLTSRFFIEDQLSLVGLGMDSSVVRSDDRTELTDWNLSPVLEWWLSPVTKMTGKIYLSRYKVDGRLEAQEGSAIFNRSHFDQSYRQAEAQLDATLSPRHLLKIGGGGILESVEADRITGGKRHTQNYVAFLQHEWLPHCAVDVIASGRLDAHSDYNVHFSPKLAAAWRMGEGYHLKTSIGSGFKAPTFSQLYLDFTNPQVGYSVFGSTGVADALKALISRGEIREVLVAPSSLQRLKAESSTAVNLTGEATPFGFLRLRANVFRNDVRDLIDAQPIARKTNNQSVFTYFNLNRVYTQGVEAEATFSIGTALELVLGYQYVIAKDKEVIERIENGEINKRGSSGRIRPVQPEEYGGLFNRSRNSGTARLTYEMDNGLVCNLRAIFRGKFGLFDVNGNGILDDQHEYAAPYVLVNLHAAYPVAEPFEISVGAENMLDYVDAESLAGAPGRIIYAKLSWDWKKKSEGKP